MIGDLVKRPAELPRIPQEAYNDAYSGKLVNSQHTACHGNDQIADMTEHVHEGPHCARIDLRFGPRLLQPRICCVELLCHPLFLMEQLNRLLTGYCLLNKAVKAAELLLLALKLPLRNLGYMLGHEYD
ncbi:hypothetical protein D3C78_866650 [compost metagenome]